MKPAAADLARPVTAAVVVLYACLSATPEKERKGQSLSCVRLSAAPWSVARQAPLSMGFSRQEDLSGLPRPPPGDPPDPGMETGSPALQADALPLSQQCISYLRRRGRRNKKAGDPCPASSHSTLLKIAISTSPLIGLVSKSGERVSLLAQFR